MVRLNRKQQLFKDGNHPDNPWKTTLNPKFLITSSHALSLIQTQGVVRDNDLLVVLP